MALRWSRLYLPESELPGVSSSFVLAGHQPELFHPGVWFKNFVLENWAGREQRRGINLIVDNDQQNANWLKFPANVDGRTVVRRQNFDHGGIGLPYEERLLRHEERFGDLPRRVTAEKAEFAAADLLDQFWQRARLLPMRNLGHRFSAARHQMEWEQGVRNLEVPLSHVCQTRGFVNFAFDLIQQIPRFHQVYNQVLADYRDTNQIAGNERPVPDLEQRNDWFEVPFWLWSSDFPMRQRAYARPCDSGFQLTSMHWLQGQGMGRMEPVAIHDAESLLELGGWKLRTRALTTTMYSRAVLSDGFLHGIGGAIYDQITDEVFFRFYEEVLPPFLTATATFRLPGPHQEFQESELRQARQQWRDMRWKPERFVSTGSVPSSWLEQKRTLIDVGSEAAPEKLGLTVAQWHRQIQSVNAQLAETLSVARQQQWERIQQLEQGLASRKIEESREWSFLLFDKTLPGQLRQCANEAMDRFWNTARDDRLSEVSQDREISLGAASSS